MALPAVPSVEGPVSTGVSVFERFEVREQERAEGRKKRTGLVEVKGGKHRGDIYLDESAQLLRG